MSAYPNNIQLGIWLDDLRLGVKQGLKAIESLHLEAVGLDAFSADLSPRTLGQSGRRDLGQFVRARGATLTAMRADVGARRLADSNSLDVNLSMIREAMQFAADLSVSQIVVPCGYVPAVDDKDGARTRATLCEAAKTLAMFSSNLGVRVCWLSGGEAPETLASFLNEVETGGLLEVDLNPGAYVMRGIDPLKALQSLSSRVGMARAVDHYRGGAEAPFGKGDVRWGEVLIGLSTLQRNKPISMLAGCTLDGDRLLALSNAYRAMQQLRANPLG